MYMKTNCIICGSKMSKNERGFLNCLDPKEMDRFSKIERKRESICLDCKKDLLYSSIISPF